MAFTWTQFFKKYSKHQSVRWVWTLYIYFLIIYAYPRGQWVNDDFLSTEVIEYHQYSLKFGNKLLLWRHNGRGSVSIKSPAPRLFTQPFIQARIKQNIKAPRHWPLCGEITRTGEFPAQRAIYAEMFPFDDVIMCRNVQSALCVCWRPGLDICRQSYQQF